MAEPRVCPRCTLLQREANLATGVLCDDVAAADAAAAGADAADAPPTAAATSGSDANAGTAAAAAAATAPSSCASCLGLIDTATAAGPAEFAVAALAACIAKRGYDAQLSKLEFMTKDFEAMGRDDPGGRGAATTAAANGGGAAAAALPLPSLGRVKDAFRAMVKAKIRAHPALSKLRPWQVGEQGALLMSIRLIDLQQPQGQKGQQGDAGGSRKRARRGRQQQQQQVLASSSGGGGSGGGGGGKAGERDSGAAAVVQNAALEVIPDDHQSFTMTVLPRGRLGVNARVFREPVLVFGRYLKCSRRISQTPWVIGGARKGESSVEEALAGPVMARFRPTTFKFHSAGREDFNVRMCGNGRPFVFELIDAQVAHTSPADYAALEAHMNDWRACPTAQLVRVNNLRAAGAEFEQLKEGAETKRKSYSSVVWVSRPMNGPADLAVLDATKELVVTQTTPLRVAHRRSLMDRPKVIHSMKTTYLNPHFFVLELVAAAGTYIKEFVHGDRGRTAPSVGTLLGCRADILQLDVNHLIDSIGRVDGTDAPDQHATKDAEAAAGTS